MSRLAILAPDTLVGLELKQQLESRRELWDELTLLTLDGSDYATLSEVAGEAALVQPLEPRTLAGTDLLFVCTGPAVAPGELLPGLEGAGTVIFVSPTHRVEGGHPVVAGVNLAGVRAGELLVSPPAASVALAHLLHPLTSLGLEEATGVVLQPASDRGQEGLDELLDQTRAILAFSDQVPEEVLGRRLALNLYPAPSAEPLVNTLSVTLPDGIALSLEVLQAAVFHTVSLSVRVRCAAGTTAKDLRSALGGHPAIELAESKRPPGPVEVAGRDRLVVGRIAADPVADGLFWLWAVADNLTFGGASNAVAIAEALLAPPS